MLNRGTYYSIAKRVASMIAAWLLIGAIVGGMGNVGVIAGAIGGMMITFVLGTLGGLLGCDAIGTLIGACVLALASIAGLPIDVRFAIMFGGLLGGTIRPWLRMTYRLLLGAWLATDFLARQMSALTMPHRPSLSPHWNRKTRAGAIVGQYADRVRAQSRIS
jgi:hypothetical protein